MNGGHGFVTNGIGLGRVSTGYNSGGGGNGLP